MNRREFLQNTAVVGLASLIPSWATGTARVQAVKGEPIFKRLLSLADRRRWSALPIGELVGAVGMELRGIPYVGGTLDADPDHEVCLVDLEGLDCVTFYEACLSFARMLKMGGRTPDAMIRETTRMRYRAGKMDGYLSRLHYTSDWLFDNSRRGIVRLLTSEIPGAERYTHAVGYMSTHSASYAALKAHPDWVASIGDYERQINSRPTFYLPKERVAAAESRLRTGDILGLTTAKEGLDTSHTALCYRDGQGVLRILHASSDKKEVTLGEELAEYLARIRRDTGIMIARPIEPHS